MLGLYIHVPFCARVCPYCDFYSIPKTETNSALRERYLRALVRELDLLLESQGSGRPLLPSAPSPPPAPSDSSIRCVRSVSSPSASSPPILRCVRPLRSVYFGGGTPALLPPRGIAAVLNAVRERFALHPRCEVTLEANPETLLPSRLGAWRAAGVNRLSLGAQAFDDDILARLGRGHTADAVRRAIRRARKAGFENLSLDLMFGLPGQTLQHWMASIEEAVAWRPEHVSFYGLTLHEDTPFHARHAEGALPLPDDESQAEMVLAARRRLREAGYEHYEISNFALPGRRAVHNETYWVGGDWLGLGPAAHSSLTRASSGEAAEAEAEAEAGRFESRPLRWENPPSLDAWLGALESGRLPRTPPSALSLDEARIEAVFLGLRRLEGLDLDALARSPLALDFEGGDRAPATRRLVEAGLLHRPTPRRLALTERGLLVADAVMVELV